MRWIWLHFRVCQCMQPDKRLVQRLGWLQNDVLAAIEAEPIVCSVLIRLNNEVVMAIRPTPNPGVCVWAMRHDKLKKKKKKGYGFFYILIYRDGFLLLSSSFNVELKSTHIFINVVCIDFVYLTIITKLYNLKSIFIGLIFLQWQLSPTSLLPMDWCGSLIPLDGAMLSVLHLCEWTLTVCYNTKATFSLEAQTVWTAQMTLHLIFSRSDLICKSDTGLILLAATSTFSHLLWREGLVERRWRM